MNTPAAPREASPAGVCMVAESFFPNLDGSAVYTRSLGEALVRAGHPVQVLTRRNLRGYALRQALDGMKVRRVGPTDRWGRLGRYLAMFTILPPLLTRRQQFQLMLVTNLRILGAPAVLVARLLGKTCVVRTDSCGEMSGEYAFGELPPGWKRRLLQAYFGARNLLLLRAHAFVAISSDIAAEFRRAGLPEERIVLLPNGIDTSRFAPAPPAVRQALRRRLGLAADAVVSVYAGRLTREKGLPLLLRAWRRLHEQFPASRLLMVGSGEGMSLSCEAELRSYAAAHGLQQSISFTGAVDSVHEYLQAADLFVFPSRTEALGLALIEAQACGLPAVASNVGGIPDVLVDGVGGRLIAADDEEALVAALTELHLVGNEARRRLGMAGRRHAVETFDLERIALRYMELFADL